MAVIFTLVKSLTSVGGGVRLAATNEIQTNVTIEKIPFMISQTNPRYNQFGENAKSIQSTINVAILFYPVEIK